jgi:CDP-glucose 4,6-dehydratase
MPVNTSFWTHRPVLVTGATGLIGSWMVKRLLREGASVVCLVRDADLLERALAEYEIKTVMHLAAQTIVGTANRHPVATFEANIQGTWNVLEACRRNGRISEVLIASSDKAYGAHEVLPYTEDAPLQGMHPYDVSKSCADLIAQTYAHSYDLPVGITRCGNFYGGGDLNWNRIVPGTVRALLHGETPVIRSDGQFVRDYLYVEDGVDAYFTFAEHLSARPELRGRAFNFSNELQITVVELVEKIRELMHSDLQPEVRNEASNEIREQYLDASRAREELGWNTRHGLTEGLEKTIAWYRTFFERADS